MSMERHAKAVPFHHYPAPVGKISAPSTAHLMDRLLHSHTQSQSQRLCSRGLRKMWHAKASVVGEPSEFLSRKLWGRHVSEISLEFGVSGQVLVAPKPLLELCLGFQIRQADYMELLLNELSVEQLRIKIFYFIEIDFLFSRHRSVCVLAVYPREHLPNPQRGRINLELKPPRSRVCPGCCCVPG